MGHLLTHWNRWVTHRRLSGDWGYLAVRGNSPCMDKGLAWIKTNTSAAVAPDQSEWVSNKWGGVVTVFTRHRYSMTGSVCITMSCCARKQALYRVCSVRVEKWRTSSMVPFPLALSPPSHTPPPPLPAYPWRKVTLTLMCPAEPQLLQRVYTSSHGRSTAYWLRWDTNKPLPPPFFLGKKSVLYVIPVKSLYWYQSGKYWNCL